MLHETLDGKRKSRENHKRGFLVWLRENVTTAAVLLSFPVSWVHYSPGGAGVEARSAGERYIVGNTPHMGLRCIPLMVVERGQVGTNGFQRGLETARKHEALHS